MGNETVCSFEIGNGMERNGLGWNEYEYEYEYATDRQSDSKYPISFLLDPPRTDACMYFVTFAVLGNRVYFFIGFTNAM